MTAPLSKLNDGNSIPCVGLGVYKTPRRDTEGAVAAALEVGYRHIDTASMYGNEREVGRAVTKASIPREEIFVVTKLWNTDQGYDATMRAFDKSMRRLGFDRHGGYLDMYLIHWPVPALSHFVDTWRAFAALHDLGRIRSIGVSNFAPEHLNTLIDATGVVPVVNQIELHPLLNQSELREVHAQLGIATEAWSPLGRGRLLDHPAITAIAEACGRTPAQVIIRWHLQIGNIIIPKSVNSERIASNLDVFDFELSDDDVTSISSLDNGTRLGPDPRTYNFTGR